jgi:hypothetical protein
MPSSTIRREQSVERHLLAAAEFIAVAESGDAKRAAYEHAADEILAAQEEDPKLSLREIDRRLGRVSPYASKLVRWRKSGAQEPHPFGGEEREESRIRWQAKRAASERPDAFVEAYRQAPPAAQQQISTQLAQEPTVRIAVRKRDTETTSQRQPSPVKSRADHTLYEFESRLVSARRDLREALALVDKLDAAGDDEDILALLRDCEGLLSAATEAYTSGKSIDTWAWELYERSGDR